MSARTVAFLLAVLMLWSGLAVTEQRFAEALELPEQSVSLSGDPKRSDVNGSMDDHVVDDQPAQSFGEPALVFAALVDSVETSISPRSTAAVCPAQPADRSWETPLLQGIRRPPKSA
jgi:hypothetical protein